MTINLYSATTRRPCDHYRHNSHVNRTTQNPQNEIDSFLPFLPTPIGKPAPIRHPIGATNTPRTAPKTITFPRPIAQCGTHRENTSRSHSSQSAKADFVAAAPSREFIPGATRRHSESSVRTRHPSPSPSTQQPMNTRPKRKMQKRTYLTASNLPTI